MTSIKIKDITEGMVLASDVKGPNGKLLLAKDTVMNNKHIKILKTWGVHEINIPGDTEEDEVEYSEEELNLANEQFNNRIVAKNPSSTFFELITPFVVRSIAKKTRGST